MNWTDEALFNRLADGVASEGVERRLAEVLRGDSSARKAYREFASLHSALHWDYVAAAALRHRRFRHGSTSTASSHANGYGKKTKSSGLHHAVWGTGSRMRNPGRRIARFRGLMDELAIWSRVLPEEEIKRMPEVGRPGLIRSKK